jgi:rubrerythrin
MKLKTLRECYTGGKGGSVWVPKQRFDTYNEVKRKGFNSTEWRTYRCRVCGYLHVASVVKVEVRDKR